MIFAKPVAIYLKLVAAAVVVNFFAFPFYGPGDEPGDPANLDVWNVLDWFMAAALALVLITTWQRRSAASFNDRSARAMFIFAVAVTIAFVPNWFRAMVDGGDNFTIWHLIDTALPILLWMEGHRLWKAS
ncbi:hypothetical protein [Candidatus Poriferisodalis sp.]|uniref:hypothetical protein n=1 Tax=Candidatus Poriferisodalis sp. TaxID=3101277 RepID=UPI003B02462A